MNKNYNNGDILMLISIYNTVPMKMIYEDGRQGIRVVKLAT